MVDYLLWLGLAILVMATARAAFLRRRTRRALRALASRRRLNYAPSDLIGAYERYQHLRLIDRGHSRHTWNVLYGTTPQGLLTLFAFACERGLGTNRLNQERWVAVLEAPQPHAPWRAYRPNAVEDHARAPCEWQIQAEHEETQRLLEKLDLHIDDDGLSHEREWEVQGRLLVLTCPYTHDPQVPERMIDEILRVADQLGKLEKNLPDSVPAAP